MTLKETLSILSIETKYLDVRVFIRGINGEEECVDVLRFECDYPTEVIDSIGSEYLDCEVTDVRMVTDCDNDLMIIDIFRKPTGRKVILSDSQLYNVLSAVSAEIENCSEWGGWEETSVFHDYYLSLHDALSALNASEPIYVPLSESRKTEYPF